MAPALVPPANSPADGDRSNSAAGDPFFTGRQINGGGGGGGGGGGSNLAVKHPRYCACPGRNDILQRVPKKAVDLIESKTCIMDDSGSILLHDDTGPHVAASFKRSKDGRLIIQGGFWKYVIQLEMKENDLVVITFHKRAGSASMTVRMCILS
ncbi:hypothetical protein ACQJBY_066215 [Aegilops geniculata]